MISLNLIFRYVLRTLQPSVLNVGTKGMKETKIIIILLIFSGPSTSTASLKQANESTENIDEIVQDHDTFGTFVDNIFLD